MVFKAYLSRLFAILKLISNKVGKCNEKVFCNHLLQSINFHESKHEKASLNNVSFEHIIRSNKNAPSQR